MGCLSSRARSSSGGCVSAPPRRSLSRSTMRITQPSATTRTHGSRERGARACALPCRLRPVRLASPWDPAAGISRLCWILSAVRIRMKVSSETPCPFSSLPMVLGERPASSASCCCVMLRESLMPSNRLHRAASIWLLVATAARRVLLRPRIVLSCTDA